MHLQHILQFCFTIGSQINLQYNAQIVGLKLMFKNTTKIINDDPIIISHICTISYNVKSGKNVCFNLMLTPLRWYNIL